MSRVPRLLGPGLPASGRWTLEGDEAHHVVRVLRARPGDAVNVFDGAGREAACVVAAVHRDAVELDVVREIASPRPSREVVLCAAIPRGERMEWMVEKCVEAGVARILPLAADRSVRKEAGPNAIRRWRRAAAEAAKQCGRADVPDVGEPVSLEEALVLTAAAVRLVADPSASARIEDVVPASGAVAVFVGPEGGFGPAESSALRETDARPFGLGRLILRVETAAVLAVHRTAT